MNTKTGVALGSLIILAIAAVVMFGLTGPQRAGHLPATDDALVPQGKRITQFNPDNQVLRRMAESTDQFALYQELLGKGEGESLYLAAEIASACTGVLQQGLPALLKSYQSRLKAGDPDRAARLAAFHKLNEPCAGFAPERLQGQRLQSREQLVARAAELGYLPAIMEMRMKSDAARRQQAGGAAKPGDAWVIEALESGDAAAINLAVAHIAGRPGGYMVVGRSVEPGDQDSAYFAWRLIVCERGYPCEHEPRLSFCAYSGICNASTYDDALQRFLGPQRYTKAQIYKLKITDALARKDYPSIGLR